MVSPDAMLEHWPVLRTSWVECVRACTSSGDDDLVRDETFGSLQTDQRVMAFWVSRASLVIRVSSRADAGAVPGERPRVGSGRRSLGVRATKTTGDRRCQLHSERRGEGFGCCDAYSTIMIGQV